MARIQSEAHTTASLKRKPSEDLLTNL